MSNRIIRNYLRTPGSIIPFAADGTCTTSSLNGLANIATLISFSSSPNSIQLSNNKIDLSLIDNAIREFSFIIPKNSILKSIFASIVPKNELNTMEGDTITFRATIYRAIGNTIVFEPIAETVFNSVNILTPLTVLNSSNNKLYVTLKAGDRILFSISNTSTGLSSYNLQFYANGGINIL